MLNFQYTGALAERYCSVGGFQSLFEMYSLANRYVIHDLLSYCLGRLVAQIDFENALKTYVRCKALGLQSLEVAALAFMSKYPELMCSLHLSHLPLCVIIPQHFSRLQTIYFAT